MNENGKKPAKVARRWTATVTFLTHNHWTPKIAVTVEHNDYAIASKLAVRLAKQKAALKAGRRVDGLYVYLAKAAAVVAPAKAREIFAAQAESSRG